LSFRLPVGCPIFPLRAPVRPVVSCRGGPAPHGGGGDVAGRAWSGRARAWCRRTGCARGWPG
jgi:hypothetical protein